MTDRRAKPRPTPDRRKTPWAGLRQRRETPWTGPRERRAAPRPAPQMIGGVHVEALDVRAATANAAEWSDLARRAAEPNPFYEPEFVLPYAQRLLTSRQPRILVARKRIDGRMRMIGLLPLAPGGPKFGFAPVRGWRNDQTPLGVPLLDRDCAQEAFAAVSQWIARFHPKAGGLLLHAVPADGPAAVAMRAAARERGAACVDFEAHERAALFAGSEAGVAISGGRRRKFARLRRRLSEKGELRFHLEDGTGVAAAMEQFLALESSGWKGARGTALFASPMMLGVARAFARRLAAQGRCLLAMLELDGAPVAAGVLATSGPLAAWWKTAYDERYAQYSPGALLTLDISDALLRRPAIETIDSCAIPDHPLLDTMWSGRIRIVDLHIGASGLRFGMASQAERWRRDFRAAAKTVFLGVTGRKRV